MDNFIVSARKYRPSTFETVVGQQHITGTLKNAIKNNQLAQAFLFCGPRGVGKTTCARILAKTINCQQLTTEVEACGVCDSCRSFQQGNSFSIHELDAASNNSVDDIRSLIEQVRIPPQTGKYKIYIIDEVHMLSTQAFNAFLKTLEEPPTYAIFILATTEKHKILPTILSRCQIFDFNRIKIEHIAQHLANIAAKEGVAYDSDGLHLIAQKADGGLRDALSMFDQIVSFSNKNVNYQAVIDNLNILDYDYYFKLTDAILEENAASALVIFDEILLNGFDGNHFINGLASHFRNLLVGKDASTLKLLEVSENIRARYLEQSQQTTVGLLLSALNIANQCEINYRTSKNQRLQVELALLKMCHIKTAVQFSSATNDNLNRQEPEKKKPDAAVTETPSVSKQEPLNPSPQKEYPGDVEKVENERETPQPTKVKIPSFKDIKLSSSIPNLNDVFKDKKEDDPNAEPEYIMGAERQSFDYENFMKVWHAYADQAKATNKITLFTLMTANAPKLRDDHKIEVIVENAIQENLLTISKIEILNDLRVKLKNFAIDLIPVQVESNVVRKPYTNQEKYQAMLAKNPLVEKLRQDFNLGFD
ncbi:DNA polymerase III subunit gamma/tau [Olivibacter sp. SDN3]|uniref:DNA polymerase III subunit gamma/tau n=1 Tax=Olivibacter sp. SDN3 TaxID=2764720 RepID=UPI0016514849|nr:DNA polymerase III subunit gamma/tau [Olivibacter sp. SDN3]QNL52519.1 DNA polymerase III subunit gamma/tau [Olivibacter sp. SDN3]